MCSLPLFCFVLLAACILLVCFVALAFCLLVYKKKTIFLFAYQEKKQRIWLYVEMIGGKDVPKWLGLFATFVK